MISRRSFLHRSAGTVAAAYLPSTALALAATGPAKSSHEDPLQWLDISIGTGGHGHCFPGAAVPFGAVQLSPDTYDDDWDWCSGYHISNTSIMGFSHTHLSGTGCGDLLDFLVMPGIGEVKLVPGTVANPELGYLGRAIVACSRQALRRPHHQGMGQRPQRLLRPAALEEA
jgi:putative alpha-1,2-mannosidase